MSDKYNMKKRMIFTFLIITLLSVNHLSAQTDTTGVAKKYTMDEVVVTGTRNETDIRHLPMTISVVNREQIEKRYEPSLLPSLSEQVPGLFITSRGVLGYGVSDGAAGGMSLRGIGGGSAARMLVLIDGHPQYMGLFGHPISDAYQSMLAEKVEVVRGPASVLYGSNAMGGVINIVTRKQLEDGIKTGVRVGYGSYNTLMTEATNRIRQGKFNSVVTGSYNRTDGHRDDMGFEQYGGYIKLGYELGRAWDITGDVNITQFKASNPGEIYEPVFDNDSRITRGVASFSVENNYNRTSGALKLFYNWGRHKINDGYSEGDSPLDYRFHSKDKMLGVSWYQSVVLFTGNRLTIGVDYQHFGGEAWNYFLTDGHKESLSDKTENEVAGYVDFRQQLGRYLTLDAGIRLDHHSVTGTELIPQVGLSAQLSQNSNLKAMASKGFRNPTVRELYMFRPANPELLPERMWNYELSYSQRLLNNTFYYGVNLFYINGDHLIQTVRIDGRPLNINTNQVENWGAEVNLTYRIHPSWRVSANYSWLRMVHPVIASPEHKLYAGLDYSKNRWSLSTGIQYIAGLYVDIDTDTRENFVLWNLRGSYRLCAVADLFVKGENLLAQRYEINAGFPMPKATFMGGVNINF